MMKEIEREALDKKKKENKNSNKKESLPPLDGSLIRERRRVRA